MRENSTLDSANLLQVSVSQAAPFFRKSKAALKRCRRDWHSGCGILHPSIIKADDIENSVRITEGFVRLFQVNKVVLPESFMEKGGREGLGRAMLEMESVSHSCQRAQRKKKEEEMETPNYY